MKKYYSMKSRVEALEQMEIRKVVWHKNFLNWFGTIEITGIPTNIREDQSKNEVIIIVPNLSIFCYKFWFFSGSLRRFLKQSKAEFERKYKKFKFK